MKIVGDLAENYPSVRSRNVHTRMIIISGRVFNFLGLGLKIITFKYY